MKHITKLLPVIFAITFWACSKPSPEPEPRNHLRTSATQLTVSGNGAKLDSFLVESNIKWNITLTPSTAEWLSVSPATGDGDGKVFITIKQDNKTSSNRTATVTIAAENNMAPNVVVAITQSSYTSAFHLEWSQLLGGPGDDIAYSTIPASDGGAIIIGNTFNDNSGDIPSTTDGGSGFLMKLSATGTKQWVKAVGGNSYDVLYGATPTPDGGYLACGRTSSSDIPRSGTGTGYIARLDASGNLLWQKAIGTMQNETFMAVTTAHDGGFLLTGEIVGKVLVVKVDDSGNLLWQKTFDGYMGWSVVKSPGNGYVIAADDTQDVLAYKIDNAGNLVWKKTLGGSGQDGAWDLEAVADGYVLGAYSGSNDGHVSGNHGAIDTWLIKLDLNGNLQWQKCLGGPLADRINSMVISPDGQHYLIAGESYSSSGDVTSNAGGTDAWVVQVNQQGKIIAQESFGGSKDDRPFGIAAISATEYVVAGHTESTESHLGTPKGNSDVLVFKIKLK